MQTDERSSAETSQRNPNRFRPKYNLEDPIQEARSTPMVELLFPGSSLKNYSVDLNQQRPTLNKPTADRRKSVILPANRRDQILNNRRNQNPSGQERPSHVRPNQNPPNSPISYERPNQNGHERSVLYERPNSNEHYRPISYERPNSNGHERPISYEKPVFNKQDNPKSVERQSESRKEKPNPFLLKKDVPTKYIPNYQDAQSQR